MAILSPLLMWCGLFALAAANGAFREFVLAPWLGGSAQFVSGIVLMVALGLAAWLYLRRRAPTFRAAALIGGLWFALTLLAETLLVWRGGAELGESVREVGATFSIGAMQHGELFALAAILIAVMPMLVSARQQA